MKKKFLLLLSCLLLLLFISGCIKQTTDDSDSQTEGEASTKMVDANVTPAEEAATTYKDGTYEVETKPDVELYVTKATVKIEDGKITAVDWTIYDSQKRPFDETYEKVFAGNSTYMQQSRDDWNGSRDYEEVLIDTQDVDKVDAVSGATWTNKKFKDIVKMALEQAKE